MSTISDKKMVDLSSFSSKEKKSLPRLVEYARRHDKVVLKGDEGVDIELPKPLFDLLMRAIVSLQNNEAVSLMPHNAAFTTQAAADFLGMSRQHLVRILDAREIPFTKVGTHRRVTFGDLKKYAEERTVMRKKKLDALFDSIHEEGLYD